MSYSPIKPDLSFKIKRITSPILIKSNIMKEVATLTTPQNIYNFFSKIHFINNNSKYKNFIITNSNVSILGYKNYVKKFLYVKSKIFEKISMYDIDTKETKYTYIDKMNYINIFLFYLSSEIQMYIILSYCIQNQINMYSLSYDMIHSIIFEYFHCLLFKSYSEIIDIDIKTIEKLFTDTAIIPYLYKNIKIKFIRHISF